MVANGLKLSTYVYLSFEKEDVKVVVPSSVNLTDPALEQITLKRLKSVEKGYIYPYISMSFIRASSICDKNNNSSHSSSDQGGDNSRDCKMLLGLFECVQTISGISKGKQFRNRKAKMGQVSDDGFLIFAYQTMEDMYNSMFAASWKTWTGARLLCTMLPERLPVKRLSFFKKVGKCHGFTYILMAQIEHLMLDCAPALNVLHYMKPKICAVVGAYRGITFRVDADMLHTLHVNEEDHIIGYVSKLKILYSNNSVSIEFPDYLEFREDEETDEQGNKIATVTEKVMVSEETQTIIKSVANSRRRLPRTISIYDFPSMKDKEESTLTFKTFDLIEELDVNGVIDFVDCPKGVWRRKHHRKNGVVVFNELNLLNSNQAFGFPVRLPILNVATDSLQITTTNTLEKTRKYSDDSLLSRLKFKYFNSPDYSREEFLNC